MTNDSPNHAQSVESCTVQAGIEHRFDLYSALIGVADAWFDSLPNEPRGCRPEMEQAFNAVAHLAAREVFG